MLYLSSLIDAYNSEKELKAIGLFIDKKYPTTAIYSNIESLMDILILFTLLKRWRKLKSMGHADLL